ncbi:hypothetical protein TNCV_602221 [Trichonephila clavipes]|nr:hypothetical protein TNCV_602221 [Trichonephila clavipes]
MNIHDAPRNERQSVINDDLVTQIDGEVRENQSSTSSKFSDQLSNISRLILYKIVNAKRGKFPNIRALAMEAFPTEFGRLNCFNSSYHRMLGDRLKDLRKGPISRIGLRKLIKKSEEIGDLRVLPERGHKPIGRETVEEVAADAVKRAFSSFYSSASGPSV